MDNTNTSNEKKPLEYDDKKPEKVSDKENTKKDKENDNESTNSVEYIKPRPKVNRIIIRKKLVDVNKETKISGFKKNNSTKQIKKRSENYLCLSWKCLSHRSCSRCVCKGLIKHMCGSPFYIWVFLILIGLAAIGAIVWLTLNIQIYNETNKTYFVLCNSTNDCDASLGLYCPPEDNLCGCPANKTKGRCDCYPGYFWDGSRCSQTWKINTTGCLYNYYCDQTNNLLCINRTCQCKWPMSWDAARNICDYQYIGCYWVNVGGQTMRTENLNVGELNFVESCINVCNRLSMKYAIIYSSNSDNFCVCSATGYTPAQASTCCNQICTSTIKQTGRLCGSRNTGWYLCKSVYLAN